MPDEDDTLILMFLCCHDSLTPASAIPLTLRAVGGLTTREIAAAYLVPEATMAQRISRAKQRIKSADARFAMPADAERGERLGSVLRVLYLLFNEGYATSAGNELARTDLSGEAVRLTRILRQRLPDDPEVAGLLALMLLTDARRPARTRAGGELVPLERQNRALWDRGLIAEGRQLIQSVFGTARSGSTSCKRRSPLCTTTPPGTPTPTGREILALYDALDRLTGNPMVTLNRAVAAAMVHGPGAGLAMLDTVADTLGEHHRLHAVRAHLLERAGRTGEAVTEFSAAAAGTTNLPEQHYLTTQAARLRAGIADPPEPL